MLGLERTELFGDTGFPYEVPALAAIEQLRLDAPVTLLAGDNGTGKSTIVEAVAEAMGFASQGGELERSGELPPVPRAVIGRGAVAPVLSRTKPRNGYFLRGESFFNVAAFVGSEHEHAPDLSLYGDGRYTSSRTGSRSSRSPPTASAARACTCSTSPRPRCR